MNLDSFARFFVRFNGLCFLFWALHDALYSPIVFSNFTIVQDEPAGWSILHREFYVHVSQIALQLLGAAILLGRTDKVITLVLTGQWRLPAASGTTHEKKG